MADRQLKPMTSLQAMYGIQAAKKGGILKRNGAKLTTGQKSISPEPEPGLKKLPYQNLYIFKTLSSIVLRILAR